MPSTAFLPLNSVGSSQQIDSAGMSRRGDNPSLSDDFLGRSQHYHFRDCGCSTCSQSIQYKDFDVSSSPDYQALIWDYQVLDANIGYSEEVEYSLFYGSWEFTQTYNHRDHELGVMRHTQEQEDFVVSVFERLERVIDLDFTRVASNDTGDIRIYRAYSNSDWGNRFSGGGVGGGTMYGQGAGIDLEWRDESSTDAFNQYEKSTIVHEIGHALGLQHPDGVGANPNWDSYDSIMSYNDPEGEPINTWFTSYDIDALQSIWGAEANNDPELVNSQSDLSKGVEDSSYLLEESTLLIGFDDIDSTDLSVNALASSVGEIVSNGGSFTLNLPKDFYGEVTLSYEVVDGDGGSLSAINKLLIESVNDLPVLSGLKTSLPSGQEDASYVLSASSLIQGYTDVDSSSLSVDSLTSSIGNVVDDSGTFMINLPQDFNGSVELSYEIVDGDGGSVAASNSFAVEAINDSPSRKAFRFPLKKGKEDQPYLVKAKRLLKEFTDVDSIDLAVNSLTSSSGKIVDNKNGTFTLNPEKDFHGKVIMSYIVIDGDGGSTFAKKAVFMKNMPDGVVKRGGKGRDRLIGSSGNDTLIGKAGSDKLLGKKGDDLIDPGRYTKGQFDTVIGGKGGDTFVIKDGYWAFVKDFKIADDFLDLNGLKKGLSWDSGKGMTYIYGKDGYEVARLKGRVDLSSAQFL